MITCVLHSVFYDGVCMGHIPCKTGFRIMLILPTLSFSGCCSLEFRWSFCSEVCLTQWVTFLLYDVVSVWPHDFYICIQIFIKMLVVALVIWILLFKGNRLVIYIHNFCCRFWLWYQGQKGTVSENRSLYNPDYLSKHLKLPKWYAANPVCSF